LIAKDVRCGLARGKVTPGCTWEEGLDITAAKELLVRKSLPLGWGCTVA